MTTRRSALPTLRMLAHLPRVSPWRYALNAVIWSSVWLMPLLIGLLAQRFFNTISGVETGWNVPTLVALVWAYVLFRIAVVFLGLWNDQHFEFRVWSSLRKRMLSRLYGLPGARAVEETPGEAISRFREDVEHSGEALAWTPDMIGVLIMMPIALVILTSIDVALTVFVVIPLVAVIVLAERAGTRIRRYRHAAREATEQITGFLGETFASVQAVKVAGAERQVLDRFQRLNGERRRMMVRDRTLVALLESVFWNTVNIGTAIVLIVSASMMTRPDDPLTVGEFALFVFFLGLLTDATYFAGLFIARVKQAGVSFERMVSLMRGSSWRDLVDPAVLHLSGEVPGVATPRLQPSHTLGRLSVKGLTYRHQNSGEGIEDVDFEVPRGSFTVITGRIGSGKTTLVRTLLGLLPAHSGEVRWNDTPVDDPARFFIPPISAYTPQVPNLFSMSLRDNLLLGRDDTDEEVEEAIAAAVLDQDIGSFPLGLDTLVGPRGMRLSGGQAQRTAAARTFLRRPELYVFDDLSSALDVETERLLWERLLRDDSGATALVVSHRHPALRRADQILVMDRGRIVARGKLAELLQTSDTFRGLWEEEPED